MSIKIVLVHVDASRHAPARIALAAQFARAHGARLVGAAALGVSRAIFPAGYDIRPGTLADNCYGALDETARAALQRFTAQAAAERVEYGTRLLCDQPDEGLALEARFADLVVVGQDDPEETVGGSVIRIPDYVILNSARPVLVAPHWEGARDPVDQVLLAWDGGKESASAMRAALPLLRQAASVSVLRLADAAGDGAPAVGELAQVRDYLAAHGVRATTLVRVPGPGPGPALLDAARDLGCGLLVMGCYGHSRLHELCLGGASRTVLADATIPVLMVH